MILPETVRRLVAPIIEWLANGGDAWQMDLAYWKIRAELMDEGASFEGPPSDILSNLDTALDSFHPEPGLHQIDETQLRRELVEAVNALRSAGYIDGQ